MAVSETGKRLLQSIPARINREDDFIKAVFAGADAGSALEAMFDYGQEVIERYARNDDVYASTGAILDRAVDFFSYLTRNYDESDESLILRMKACFVRAGDETWGTAQNVKNVFSQYFSDAFVCLLENAGDWEKTSADDDKNINYVADTSFEASADSGRWTLSGGAEYSTGEAFEGEVSVKLAGAADSASQTVSLKAGAGYEGGNYFFLHFFAINGASVKVYVDGEETYLWVVGENVDEVKLTERIFESDSGEWEARSAFFFADEEAQAARIEISGVDGRESYIDFVQMYAKQSYPQFCVYCRFTGESLGARTLSLARGDEDPTEEPAPEYEREKYFDSAFVTGAQGQKYAEDIYEDVLNLVKPCGARGFIKTIAALTEKEEE